MTSSSHSYRLALVCIVLFASLAGGCKYFGDPAQKARTAFLKGDLASARIQATNAIQKNESDAEAHLLLASILDAQGDLLTAERVLRRGASLGLDRARVDPLLARILLRTGGFKQILDDLQPGPQHQGEALGMVLAARGRALLAQGEAEQAKILLDQALAASPELPEALIGQAQLAYLRSEPQQAMALAESLLAAKPLHDEAWMLKAKLLTLDGKPEEAIAAYTKAAQAAPTNFVPGLAAAELLMSAGRFDEAHAYIQRVRKHAPEFMLGRYTEAAWHFHQRQYDKALELLQAARSASPGFVPVRQLLAMTHLMRGNPNQAEEELRTLVQTQPRNDQTRKLYVNTLIRQGKSKAALDALAPALAASPEDPAWLSLAADAHVAAREYTEAMTYLGRAAQAQGSDAAAQVRLGVLQLAAGDVSAGLRQLQQAADENTVGIAPDFSLAVMLMKQGEYAKALQVARGIQKKQPNDALGFNLAGGAQLALKDRAAAAQSFRHALGLDARSWIAAKHLAQIEADAGRPDAARKILETFVAGFPGNVEAHSALLHFTGDRGRFNAALEAARRMDAKALPPRLALAINYGARGLGEAALSAAREAVAIAPADGGAVQALGIAQLTAGRTSEALETFRRLAADQPKSARAQVLLAQTHLALDDAGAAEAALKRALAFAPDDSGATEALARLYAHAGRHAEAMSLADVLKTRLPKSALGYAVAGDLWLAQRNLAAALKEYDAAQALMPSAAVLLQRHRTAVALKQDPGVGPLEHWIVGHPHDNEVRFYLGNRHYAAGRYDAAVEQFRRIAQSDPQHALALNNLANAYLKTQDSRALPAAQAAYALWPDDANVLDTLGVALMRANRAEEAVGILKRAVSRKPGSTVFNVNYALALARSGERAAGRAVLEKLVAGGAQPSLDAEAQALLGSR